LTLGDNQKVRQQMQQLWGDIWDNSPNWLWFWYLISVIICYYACDCIIWLAAKHLKSSKYLASVWKWWHLSNMVESFFSCSEWEFKLGQFVNLCEEVWSFKSLRPGVTKHINMLYQKKHKNKNTLMVQSFISFRFIAMLGVNPIFRHLHLVVKRIVKPCGRVLLVVVSHAKS
jgi:hypothetical protein